MSKRLILASTSVFRKAILDKLSLPFETAKPQVDESPLAGETAIELVERLAIAKARAVAQEYPDALIIGSDQVALNQEQILGKPGDHQNAVTQLKNASGKVVTFYTGLCLYNSANDTYQSLVEPFEVRFKELSEAQIEGYLKTEQPYQCAGSFKSEGLGIALFERLNGRDPNTLIGLPTISLVELLANEGWDVLESLA
ncbi:Maf family protein [Paraferrimonas sedimenticola]|uniref:7-methyl-GTP pyrophosphatase n=1 Tax=Paraferrimonas sedimenticola TaxID=375674 RepID=A0AA37RVJ4_9GAMM|nr:nucleoside triphosphate pyrophosphatase [Paraferrimonas sedimenticola]GLP96500.1 Maf-like protein [Paraferrimonas sedimenticola]